MDTISNILQAIVAGIGELFTGAADAVGPIINLYILGTALILAGIAYLFNPSTKPTGWSAPIVTVIFAVAAVNVGLQSLTVLNQSGFQTVDVMIITLIVLLGGLIWLFRRHLKSALQRVILAVLILVVLVALFAIGNSGPADSSMSIAVRALSQVWTNIANWMSNAL